MSYSIRQAPQSQLNGTAIRNHIRYESSYLTFVFAYRNIIYFFHLKGVFNYIIDFRYMKLEIITT